jgi:hypothetical protein
MPSTGAADNVVLEFKVYRGRPVTAVVIRCRGQVVYILFQC